MANKAGKEVVIEPVDNHGYYLYKNGEVRWGLGVWEGHFPLKINDEIRNKSVEERVAWFKEEMTKQVAKPVEEK